MQHPVSDNPLRRRPSPAIRPAVESLEARQLLSASASVTLHSNQVLGTADAVGSTISGFTPAQIRQAYGFNSITLGDGSVAADGAGQTIAIVDAYNHPHLTDDLAVFDAQFGIAAPPSLTIVNQTGGTDLPRIDPGWANEISLDVEWAHAIAPGANILLVEASSDDVSNLLAAVDYARHVDGVSVVSMSWGGSEFASGGFGEFSSQTDYDPYFTTPAGHTPITFVAAAGDDGAHSGAEWPASSPNVLSVGGTSLYTADDLGTYASEVAWSGSSGGNSTVEKEPDYQKGAQSSSFRSTPDVSYNGNPNTGFAVYDSIPDNQYIGWQVLGGNSAGTPQWAALIAIANQGRTLTGQATLEGRGQTLPTLYSLYGAPGSAGYDAYAGVFHDVQANGGSGHFQVADSSNVSAMAGYDTATGLGSPYAEMVVSALVRAAETQPTPLGASPISGAITSSTPTSVQGGTTSTISLRLVNTSGARFSGRVTASLYASVDGTTQTAGIGTYNVPKLTLKNGASTVVKVNVTYPTDATGGSYFILGSINTPDNPSTPAVIAGTRRVTVKVPTVDLSAKFAQSGRALQVKPGKPTVASITIRNNGNVAASGTLGLNLYTSTDATLDASDALLQQLLGRKISIKPGKSVTLKIRFIAPAASLAGSYYLIISQSSNTNVADSNTGNDVSAILTR